MQAIPRVDDTVHLRAGLNYLITIDLKTGYWQVGIKETDKAKIGPFQVGTLVFLSMAVCLLGLVTLQGHSKSLRKMYGRAQLERLPHIS